MGKTSKPPNILHITLSNIRRFSMIFQSFSGKFALDSQHEDERKGDSSHGEQGGGVHAISTSATGVLEFAEINRVLGVVWGH